MADILAKNTIGLKEKELRVTFFEVLRRAPTRVERARIRELVRDSVVSTELIV